MEAILLMRESIEEIRILVDSTRRLIRDTRAALADDALAAAHAGGRARALTRSATG